MNNFEFYQREIQRLRSALIRDDDDMPAKITSTAAFGAAALFGACVTVGIATAGLHVAEEGFFPDEKRIETVHMIASSTCTDRNYFREDGPQDDMDTCEQQEFNLIRSREKRIALGESFAFVLLGAAAGAATAGTGRETYKRVKDCIDTKNRIDENSDLLKIAEEKIYGIQRYPFGKPPVKTNDIS